MKGVLTGHVKGLARVRDECYVWTFQHLQVSTGPMVISHSVHHRIKQQVSASVSKSAITSSANSCSPSHISWHTHELKGRSDALSAHLLFALATTQGNRFCQVVWLVTRSSTRQ